MIFYTASGLHLNPHKYRVKEVFIKKKCLRSSATSGAIKITLRCTPIFYFPNGCTPYLICMKTTDLEKPVLCTQKFDYKVSLSS